MRQQETHDCLLLGLTLDKESDDTVRLVQMLMIGFHSSSALQFGLQPLSANSRASQNLPV